jgi:hypothetical protein
VVGSIDLPPAASIAHHILKAILRFLCTLLISKRNDGNYSLKRLSIQKWTQFQSSSDFIIYYSGTKGPQFGTWKVNARLVSHKAATKISASAWKQHVIPRKKCSSIYRTKICNQTGFRIKDQQLASFPFKRSAYGIELRILIDFEFFSWQIR